MIPRKPLFFIKDRIKKLNLPVPLNLANFSVQGRLDWELLDSRGKVIRTGGQHNMITNVGMDGFPANLFRTGSGSTIPIWPFLRNYFVVSTDSSDVKFPSGAITASQSGTTITASASFFNPSDVGDTISWDTGGETSRIASYTSATEVEVVANEAKTVASGLFTRYATSNSSITNTNGNTNWDGGFGSEFTQSYSQDLANDVIKFESKMVRVHSFGASHNLTKFAFRPLNNTDPVTIMDLFRDGGGAPTTISVQSGQQLKATHTLSGEGGPHSAGGDPYTVTITNFADPTEGDNIAGKAGIGLDNVNSIATIWTNILSPQITGAGNTHLSAFPNNQAFRSDYRSFLANPNQVEIGNLANKVGYAAGNQYRDGTIKLATSHGNGSTIYGMGVAVSGNVGTQTSGGVEAFYFWFDNATLAKVVTHELNGNYRVSWNQKFI